MTHNKILPLLFSKIFPLFFSLILLLTSPLLGSEDRPSLLEGDSDSSYRSLKASPTALPPTLPILAPEYSGSIEEEDIPATLTSPEASPLLPRGQTEMELRGKVTLKEQEGEAGDTSENIEINDFYIPSETDVKKFIADENLDFLCKGQEAFNPEQRPLIGLSIDGGGIRGLMPAIWLEKLEEVLEESCSYKRKSDSLYKIFDCVGGSSIGGILALGVAADLRPTSLVNLLKDRRKEVFSKKLSAEIIGKVPSFFGYKVPGYKAHHLEKLLKESFGELTLRDAKTDVLVTACTDTRQPRIFRRGEEDPQYKIWQVARCTSAAPFYFEAYRPSPSIHGRVQKDEHRFVDGGIWTNNPSTLIAASLVKELGKFDPQKIYMLSLGTGEISASWKPIPTKPLLTDLPKIIDACMTSQSRGNDTMMSQLFGENYYRINPLLDPYITLDDIGHTAIEALEECARKEECTQKIKAFIKNNEDIIRAKLENRDTCD